MNYSFRKEIILHKLGHNYILLVSKNNIIDLTQLIFVNETFAEIFKEFTTKKFTTSDLTEFITKKYDINRSDASKEMIELTTQLIKQEIIVQ